MYGGHGGVRLGFALFSQKPRYLRVMSAETTSAGSVLDLSRNTPPAPELPAMGKTFKHDLMTVCEFPLVEGMHGPADAGEQGLVLACHGRRFCQPARAAQHGAHGLSRRNAAARPWKTAAARDRVPGPP